MTDIATIRALTGISADIVPDTDLQVQITVAEGYCADIARGYGCTVPETAVAFMTVYVLRNYLDLRGIKPSSISMPDLSMSTDVRSMCELAYDTAVRSIKSTAIASGGAVRHIRSGKVGRWH